MWKIIRSDAIGALNNPLVKRIMPRYVKVAKDELPACFQILKRIDANFDENFTSEQLWKLHDKKMKEFYELKAETNKGKKIEGMKISESSLLDLKIYLVKKIMKPCELCERKCGVNRWENELGVCKVGSKCLISSEFMHMGEEFHITPSHTIFFMGCTLKCQYCQNWSISQWYEKGVEVDAKLLASAIEKRRKEGSRNVNFVGGEPTPSLFWILQTLKYCEVNVATLWNSNMYMSEKTMKILDGVIDMYLSDFKYGNNNCALRLSKAPKFFETCARNHLLAAKQAEITLRLLVLPNHTKCCSKPVLDWIAKNIRNKCLVNIMDQYRPEFKAHQYPEINRSITHEELSEVTNYAKKLKINFIT